MLKRAFVWLVPVIVGIGGLIGGDILSPPAADAGSDGAGAHGKAPTGDAASKDDTQSSDHAKAADDHATGHEQGSPPSADQDTAWFTFPSQFFVPIVRQGNIESMMVLTLSIETSRDALPDLESQEHRLRDALLRSLMIQANTGGFAGNYTTEPRLDRLRADLLAAAIDAAGPVVQRVLIEDLGEAHG